MKYTILLTAATFLAAAGAFAAGPDDLKPNLPDPDAPVEIRVTTGDAGKEIKAKVGEFIVIEMDNNVMAGNTWIWTEMPGRNDSVLEAQESTKADPKRPTSVGIDGKVYFRYLVKDAGTAEIRLAYTRPWEGSGTPQRLFNVKIVAEKAAAGKTVVLETKDNGASVTVKAGDTVQVKLRSNRTTGYSWAELKDKTDAKVLKSDGGSYEVNAHPEGMVGVGGVETFTFTAVAPGRTEIALGYARPWEKDKEPAQSFKATVVVEAADAAPVTAATDAKEFALGDGDSGKSLELRVGDTVKLVLDANPTTGFSWSKMDKVDQSILKLEKNDYQQNANPGRMVGVGGKTTIVYRAVKPGTAKIDLTYMQPWEPDSKFNTDYTVTVKVVEK
ncbi:MAG: protease inhibitor I42 family protein [Lentisphaeria bacterium]|nr:protease inhibitor I42 family protein [Lentisphaeria bacterium]